MYPYLKQKSFLIINLMKVLYIGSFMSSGTVRLNTSDINKATQLFIHFEKTYFNNSPQMTASRVIYINFLLLFLLDLFICLFIYLLVVADCKS